MTGIIKGMQGQGTEVTRRVDTPTLHALLNEPARDRAAYLERYEFGYNYGPTRFPPQVFVELTSYCNLRCTFCLYPDMKRPHRHMDPALMRKVVDECAAEGVWYLTFQFYGEPLLCPDLLAEAVAHAKGRGVPNVATTSNMTLMTPEILERWAAAGLDTLNISFDGSSPEKYEEIRGRDYWEVLGRIKEARRVRDALGTGRPFLSMTLVRTDETDEQLEAFRREMEPVVDALDVRSMMLFHHRAPAIELYQDLNPNWYITRDQNLRIPCRQVGSKLIVTAEGEATVCCTDVDAELSLGNVGDKSLAELWRSDEFARLYMLHRQQRWDELPGICRACGDWDWAGQQPELEAADPRWNGKGGNPDPHKED